MFVPYFKYLLDGCVCHLTGSEDAKIGLTRKKKKAKLEEAKIQGKDGESPLSIGVWHLRSLVLSSLHKCFRYDSGTQKFLDSSNFQASQLNVFLNTSLNMQYRTYFDFAKIISWTIH